MCENSLAWRVPLSSIKQAIEYNTYVIMCTHVHLQRRTFPSKSFQTYVHSTKCDVERNKRDVYSVIQVEWSVYSV